MSNKRKKKRVRPAWTVRFFALVAAAVGILQGTCSLPPTTLDRIKENNVLRVVTRNAGPTYFFGPEGPTGPEYELARDFADALGVRLEIFTVPSFSEVLPALLNDRADIAAAHITITPQRQQRVRFGPSYHDVSQYVVYRVGNRRPRRVEDLYDRTIEVVADSSHVETLAALRAAHPRLRWTEVEDQSVETLMQRVASGETDLAIADSSAFALNRRYYPDIRIGFELATTDRIAWALRRGDHALYAEVSGFFTRLSLDGSLDRLQYRYYGHTERFDYVGTRLFIRHIDSRLPKYRDAFIRAAEETGVEWRLLAAISYQESHWNPDAVSPTGVRGLMMLTHGTARQMGVTNRRDPEQSIMGGARYFLRVKGKIPERIVEPDRTWLALAAYNVGFGHLEDARILTQINGYDPDRWEDVREHLPLLTQERWYSRVKRGYARGHEPVLYVRNVRSYYDSLVWMTSDQRPRLPEPEPEVVPVPDEPT